MIGSTFSSAYEAEFPIPHGFVDATRSFHECPVYSRRWPGVDILMEVHSEVVSDRPNPQGGRYIFSLQREGQERQVLYGTDNGLEAGAFAALLDSISDLNNPDIPAAAPTLNQHPKLTQHFLTITMVDAWPHARLFTNPVAKGAVMLHRVEMAVGGPDKLCMPEMTEEQKAGMNKYQGWKPTWRREVEFSR